jgi:uncharacterized protein YjbJ (UPF0337 family)
LDEGKSSFRRSSAPQSFQIVIASLDHTSGEYIMSKEGIEGATQKGVGAVKETIGKVVHSDKLRVEGMADKLEGSAKEAVGKAKDAVNKATR